MNTTVRNNSAQHIGHQTKKEHAYMVILEAGLNGITGLEIQAKCRVISGRNFPSHIKRDLGIEMAKTWNANSFDEGQHKRYWLACRDDAEKLIREINNMRLYRGADALPPDLAASLIAAYPPASDY